MPLFGSSRPDADADIKNNRNTGPTTPSTCQRRKRSLFKSHRHTPSPDRSPTTDDHTNRNPKTRTGFFGGKSSPSDNAAFGGGGRFFGSSDRDELHRDPTILAARQKVTEAEQAEKGADDALSQARAMVAEARNHVKILGQEAMEDARRAKAKQAQADMVSKSARGLGRHGP